jgi:hypothetical protein
MSNDSHQVSQNYETFRDLLSSALIERLAKTAPKPRRRVNKSGASKNAANSLDESAANDAEELAEFIEYIASETYQDFPTDLKNAEYYAWIQNEALQARYAGPLTGEKAASIIPSLDPSISESLVAYGALDEEKQGVYEFLAPILSEYISTVSTAPPPPRTTKTDACEICGRDWINLSYHHLIPRFVHDKVVKRGWHRKEDLENVAWLCGMCNRDVSLMFPPLTCVPGACHRFVHHFAKHEDLARYYYTVDLLLQQPEIQAFAKWAGRLRWKSR